MNILEHVSEPTKHLADGASALIAIGTLAQVLPSLAAMLTIIWLLIRIWESDTVRSLSGRTLLGKRDDD